MNIPGRVENGAVVLEALTRIGQFAFSRGRLVFAGAATLGAVLLMAGCGERTFTPAKDSEHLTMIAQAYVDALKAGKPPADAVALRPFLTKLGDADVLLKSPEDGQPYVVYWGVDWREAPVPRLPAPIVAHQRDGKNGRRHVLTVMGVQTLTDDEFAKADFITAKRK
jgi:hypothetical protein